MELVAILRWAVLGLSIPAAAWDVSVRRVPNFLSIPALVLGGAAFSISLASEGETALMALLVIPAVFIAWTSGWVGGGDAKLLMAQGLAFGPWPVVLAVSAAGLAALLARRPVPGAAFALPAVAVMWLWRV